MIMAFLGFRYHIYHGRSCFRTGAFTRTASWCMLPQQIRKADCTLTRSITRCNGCNARWQHNLYAAPRTAPQLLFTCLSRACLPQEDEDDDEDVEDVKEKEKKKVLKPPGAAKRPRPAKPRSPKAQAADAAEDGEEGDEGEGGKARGPQGPKESPVPLYYEAPTLRRSTINRVQDAERERQQQQVGVAA